MLLRHLYPEDFKPASDDPHRDGTLVAFDQSEFFDTTDESVSLHGVGYLYVPASCAAEQCRLHVAFHGCNQNVDSVYDDFIRDAGYNRWAANNNIVVLYPQTKTSAANPNRCWDFWGYSGSNYYTRNRTADAGSQGHGRSPDRPVPAMMSLLLTRRGSVHSGDQAERTVPAKPLGWLKFPGWVRQRTEACSRSSL